MLPEKRRANRQRNSQAKKKAFEIDNGNDSEFEDNSDEEMPVQETPQNKTPKGKQSLSGRQVSFELPGKKTPGKTPQKNISLLAKQQLTPAGKGKTAVQKYKGNKALQDDDEEDDTDEDEEELEQVLKQRKSNAKQQKNDMNRFKKTPVKGAENSKGAQTPKEKTPRNVEKKEKSTPKKFEDNSDEMPVQKTPQNKTPKGKQSLSGRQVSFELPGKKTPGKTPQKNISLLAKQQLTPAGKGKTAVQKYKGNKALQGDDEEDDDFELDMDDIGLEIDDMDDDEEEPEQMLKQKKSNAKQLKNDMNLKMTPLKGANNSKGLQTPKEKTPRNVLKKETATPKILQKDESDEDFELDMDDDDRDKDADDVDEEEHQLTQKQKELNANQQKRDVNRLKKTPVKGAQNSANTETKGQQTPKQKTPTKEIKRLVTTPKILQKDESDEDFELDMDDDDDSDKDADDVDEEEHQLTQKQKELNANQQKRNVNRLKKTAVKGAQNSANIETKGQQTPKQKTPKKEIKRVVATPKILGKRNAKSLYIRNLPEHVTVNELKDLSPDIVNVMTYDIKGSPSACLEFVSEDKAGYNYQILRGRKLKGQVMEIDFVGKKSKKMSADEKKPNDKLHITRIPLDASIADVAVHFPMASKITLKKSTLDRYAIISFRNEKCANEAFNSKIEIKGQTLTIKRFSLNDLGQNGKENGCES